MRRGGLLFSPAYHPVLAFQACARLWRACGRWPSASLERCAAGWFFELGQSALKETNMSAIAVPASLQSALCVREFDGQYRDATSEEILAAARQALRDRVRRGVTLDSPKVVRDFLSLELGHLEHEVFGAMFVDAQNQLIAYRELFRGTLNQASVYPREVVKEALALNAAAVILVHNHPSGVPEPSRADEALTAALTKALGTVDVRVLDHFIVGGDTTTSFAERGLL